MAKRPQQRPGELTAPALVEPNLTAPSRPVDTTITPSLAGAPSAPVLTPDPAAPDMQAARDMAAMGQALGNLSQTASTLVKAQQMFDNDRTEQYVNFLVDKQNLDDADKSLAELVEEGKFSALTPAHERAFARAKAVMAGKELETKGVEILARAVQNGELDSEYFDLQMQQAMKEVRAGVEGKLGSRVDQFDWMFNKLAPGIIDRANRKWATHVGEQRPIENAIAIQELIRQELTTYQSEPETALERVQEILEQRGLSGENTFKGAGRLVSSALITIADQAASTDPELSNLAESVLKKLKSGPKFTPDEEWLKTKAQFDDQGNITNLPEDTRKEGSLYSKPEVSSAWNEALPGITSSRKTRTAAVDKANLKARADGVQDAARKWFANAMSINAKYDLSGHLLRGGKIEHTSAHTLVEELIDGVPEYEGYEVKAAANSIEEAILVSPLGSEEVIRFDDIHAEVQSEKRQFLIEAGKKAGVPTETAMKNASMQLGKVDPMTRALMKSVFDFNDLGTMTLDQKRTLLVNQDVDVSGMSDEEISRAAMSEGQQAFENAYRQFRPYFPDNVAALARGGLSHEAFLMTAYTMMIESVDDRKTPEQAYMMLLEAEQKFQQGEADSKGLAKELGRQLTLAEQQVSPIIQNIASSFLFLQNATPNSINRNKAMQAVRAARKYYASQFAVIGGHPYNRAEYENTEDINQDQAILGGLIHMFGDGDDAATYTKSPIGQALRTGKVNPDGSPSMDGFHPKTLQEISQRGGVAGIVIKPATEDLQNFYIYTVPKNPESSFGPTPITNYHGGNTIGGERTTSQFFTIEELSRYARPHMDPTLFGDVTQEDVDAHNVAVSRGEPDEERKARIETAQQRTQAYTLLFGATESGMKHREEIIELGGFSKYEKRYPTHATELGRVLRDPATLDAYDALSDELKSALGEDFEWMGNAELPIPDRFTLKHDFRSNNFIRTDANFSVGDLIRLQTGDMSTVDRKRTTLLKDLLLSSKTGQRVYRDIINSEEKNVADQFIPIEHEVFTLPETYAYYKGLSREEKRSLGPAYFFLGDPRQATGEDILPFPETPVPTAEDDLIMSEILESWGLDYKVNTDD